MNKYAGTYAATFKNNLTITVYKSAGQLYMDLSNGTGKHMLMQPLSGTMFLLPDVKRIHTTCDFIILDGKIEKLIFTQEKKYEFTKIN